MGYQALLFCADEKTVRAVTQVLSELDFTVECSTEPFAAVKQLTAEHFDAVVVDCVNEQNASLLFKTARNSASNSSSLAVAVVEGQAGIAKAFRIGANLVLTKPINLEQSKGTLRVARSLLRKAEAAEPAAPASQPEVSVAPSIAAKSGPLGLDAPELAQPAFTPAPPRIAPPMTPVAGAALEVEEEPAIALEPAEAALLESMPSLTPSSEAHPMASVTSKVSLSQPLATPLSEPLTPASAPKNPGFQNNIERPVAQASLGVDMNHSPSGGSAATAATRAREIPPTVMKMYEPPPAAAPPLAKATLAVAGAKEQPASKKPAAKPSALSLNEEASFSWAEAARSQETSDDVHSRKNFLIAAVLVLGLAAAAYFSWPRLQPRVMSLPLVKKYLVPTQAPATPPPAPVAAPAPEPASVPATAPAAAGLEATSESTGQAAAPSAADGSSPAAPTVDQSPIPEPQSTAVSNTPPASSAPAPSIRPIAAAPTSVAKAQKPTAYALSAPKVSPPSAVKNDAKGPTKTPASPPDPAPSPAAATNSTNGIIAKTVGAPTVDLPKPVAPPVHVSQVISAGLLLKRVPPVYPPLAKQLKVEGPVQLQASIGKDGSVTSLKLLSGDAMLTRSAMEAVRQWKYKPYSVNGEPVEMQTQVTVNFRLP